MISYEVSYVSPLLLFLYSDSFHVTVFSSFIVADPKNEVSHACIFVSLIGKKAPALSLKSALKINICAGVVFSQVNKTLEFSESSVFITWRLNRANAA